MYMMLQEKKGKFIKPPFEPHQLWAPLVQKNLHLGVYDLIVFQFVDFLAGKLSSLYLHDKNLKKMGGTPLQIKGSPESQTASPLISKEIQRINSLYSSCNNRSLWQGIWFPRETKSKPKSSTADAGISTERSFIQSKLRILSSPINALM